MEAGLAKLYNTILEGNFDEHNLDLRQELLKQVRELSSKSCAEGKRCRYFGRLQLNKKNSHTIPLHTLVENATSEMNILVEEVLRNIPAMVFVKDEEMNFLMVNNQICEFLELEEEEILGMKTKELIPQWDFEHYEKHAKQVFRTGVPCYNLQDKLIINGSVRWVVTNVAPLKNIKGETCALIGVSWDVTDLKNMESYLRNSKDQAQKANQARGMYIANLSHEIRTPITSIVGMTEILQQMNLPSQQRECLDIIATSSSSLLSLVDDVLDLSKIEAGTIHLAEDPLDIYHLLEEVISVMKVKADKKALKIELLQDENIPRHLIGDAFRLKQVLFNLMSNAIKFTDAGEVSLQVKLLLESDDLVKLFFSVKDTGIGIPISEQQRVFQSFSQGNITVSRRHIGAGLGLPICKGLVRLMQGNIQVVSEEGTGSEFVFEAVLKKMKMSTETAPLTTIERYNAVQLKGRKILLAEDNALNQKIITYHLAKEGVDLDIAEDGVECWERYHQGEYELVLMDVQMPGMNGFEATRKIREYEAEQNNKALVPIVALTANAMKGDKENCMKAGMTDYVSKPFTGKDLILKIKMNLLEQDRS